MGFHSMLCEGCGHPALSAAATDAVNAWMEHVVVVRATGPVVSGSYDGYGGVYVDGESDEAVRVMGYGSGATVWHKACWLMAGCPTDWRGESASAPDQGWFFDPEDHAMKEPGS